EKALGGLLPQVLQWEKAAGRFYPYADAGQRPEGPYRGHWGGQPRLGIAVGLGAPGPGPTAKDDISVFGCRDMAGNGEELTREYEKAADTPLIDMRGRQYGGPAIPFQFRFLEIHGEDVNLGSVPLEYPNDPDRCPAVPGFRVVIEVP